MIPKVTTRTLETISQLSYRDKESYSDELKDKFVKLQPDYLDMSQESINNVIFMCGVELSDDAATLMRENMQNVVIFLLHSLYAQEEINSMGEAVTHNKQLKDYYDYEKLCDECGEKFPCKCDYDARYER